MILGYSSWIGTQDTYSTEYIDLKTAYRLRTLEVSTGFDLGLTKAQLED